MGNCVGRKSEGRQAKLERKKPRFSQLPEIRSQAPPDSEIVDVMDCLKLVEWVSIDHGIAVFKAEHSCLLI